MTFRLYLKKLHLALKCTLLKKTPFSIEVYIILLISIFWTFFFWITLKCSHYKSLIYIIFFELLKTTQSTLKFTLILYKHLTWHCFIDKLEMLPVQQKGPPGLPSPTDKVWFLWWCCRHGCPQNSITMTTVTVDKSPACVSHKFMYWYCRPVPHLSVKRMSSLL